MQLRNEASLGEEGWTDELRCRLALQNTKEEMTNSGIFHYNKYSSCSTADGGPYQEQTLTGVWWFSQYASFTVVLHIPVYGASMQHQWTSTHADIKEET